MIKSTKFLSKLFILLFLALAVSSGFLSFAQAGPGALKASPLDAKARSEVVGKVGELLTALYIFPNKAAEMKTALDRKLGNGGYDKLADAGAFAQTLTQDLRSVSKDLHIRVRSI